MLSYLNLFIQPKLQTFLQKDASTNNNNLLKYQGNLYWFCKIVLYWKIADGLVTNWQGRSPSFGLAIWNLSSYQSSFFPFLYIHFIFCLFCTETKHSLSFSLYHYCFCFDFFIVTLLFPFLKNNKLILYHFLKYCTFLITIWI